VSTEQQHQSSVAPRLPGSPLPVLPCTVVGSYPQPDWLIDRERLSKIVPRIRLQKLWRIEEPFLEQAQDDATLLAIRDLERAGLDIITDGEIRRESYSNRFATALDGVDLVQPGTTLGRTGKPQSVPRVIGPIRRSRPIERRDVEFLRKNTDRRIKITVPGPFTMTQQAVDEYYHDERALALAYAKAVNAELRDLLAAGADVVQIDEPYMQASPDKAREYGVEAVNRALEGIDGTTVLHMCFGYAAVVKDKPNQYAFLPELNDTLVQQISVEAAQPKLDLSILTQLPNKTVIVGVLDLGDQTVETPDIVADRIRAALQYVPPERLILAPDCGMKYLPRDVAFGKLCAMTEAARRVRAELG
jgi:5-methyltetrahydropteroyltriglutamate--homocysteine methyltransferase